jgi:hypothetical protein
LYTLCPSAEDADQPGDMTREEVAGWAIILELMSMGALNL